MPVVWTNVLPIFTINKIRKAVPGVVITKHFMYYSGGIIKPKVEAIDITYELDGKKGKAHIKYKDLKNPDIIASKIYRNLINIRRNKL